MEEAGSVMNGASVRRSAPRDSPFLAVLLVIILLVERFAIPIGGGNQLPLVVPAVLVMMAVGYARGNLVLDRVQTPLVLVLWLTGLVCTIAQVALGTIPSVLSIGLLLVLYAPLLVRSAEGARSLALVVRVFLITMSIAAAICLLQFLIQYVGIQNIDWMAAVVPNQFLLQGFSPNAVIEYGQTLRRSNGVVFLEPSFVSLYLGLAVLLAVRRGSPWWQILLLLAGMVPTLAGNGLVVLIPGVLFTLFSPARRRLLSLLPGAFIAVLAAVVTPLGALYIGRSGEAASSKSSSSYRFVQPYTRLMPASLDSPFHALFGHGAGSSSGFLAKEGLGLVTQPLIPKVLYEYGGLGLLGIIAVILLVMIRGLAGRPWLAGLLIAFVFLNASLLLAELVFVTSFWLTILPTRQAVDVFTMESGHGFRSRARRASDAGLATP